MRLSYLTKTCTPLWERNLSSDLEPGNDPEIVSIHYRAQEVTPGGLFIAIKGLKADGHDYIDQAIENGAVAVVVDQHVKTKIRSIAVKSTRRAMSAISARFYGNPSEKLVLMGISGTNGKTTTTWIVEHILKAAGYETGVIGTINWRYKNQVADTPVTTPESMDLQRMLAVMVTAGVTHVVMEVSSHALDLHRVRDCFFDAAIFTNLTQDHLDYHKTMGAYWACKKKLYTRQLARGSKNGRAIINIDDQRGADLAQTLLPAPITTGTGADVRAIDIVEDISGIRAMLDIHGIKNHFSSDLTGAFNLENILSAAGGAHALGIAPDIICRGIEDCKGVPGRLERVANPGNRFIFVDYAHTPNALESILKTLKLRAPGRIITVFGCGGDRDRSKRPVMGNIAATYSDIALVTSDNPRTEPPEEIIKDILTGITSSAHSHEKVTWLSRLTDLGSSVPPILVEPDRKKALQAAVELSRSGDIILAAGKGHETYQVTARGIIDFDDRLILQQAINQASWKKEEKA
ncbi:UDP-N-acetylmuramoyl-L-alanyl-D-glutamate--2,6-diaminopimelate ligase [Desulfocicer niacini]